MAITVQIWMAVDKLISITSTILILTILIGIIDVLHLPHRQKYLNGGNGKRLNGGNGKRIEKQVNNLRL